MSATGKTITFGGTATTAETRVTIPAAYRRGYPNSNQTQPTPPRAPTWLKNFSIKNNDATNNLLVRLNGMAQQNTLKPGERLPLDPGIVHDVTVQSSAATVAWDVVAIGSS